jgi:hypothetical protein
MAFGDARGVKGGELLGTKRREGNAHRVCHVPDRTVLISVAALRPRTA